MTHTPSNAGAEHLILLPSCHLLQAHIAKGIDAILSVSVISDDLLAFCSMSDAVCHALQGLAGQMQGICKAAGAILELTLPEEEEAEPQQKNAPPNGTAAGLKPKQEVLLLCILCSSFLNVNC